MTSTAKKKAPSIGRTQIRLLKRLTEVSAVSGSESAVRKIVVDAINGVVDEWNIDSLGNVLAVKEGVGKDRLRVMITAHMDEVGLMLTEKAGDGLYRFDIVGGIDPRQLVGKVVVIGEKKVHGLIGTAPVHLLSRADGKKAVPLDSLRIDIGITKDSIVEVGDRATFATTFSRTGPIILAKALDNRFGVATLIEILKNSPDNIDILAAFTVQEEVGLRGAKVAAYKFNPDIAFIFDCTPANDMPSWDGTENTQYNTILGKGPALYIADRSTISDPRLLRLLVTTAEREGIPFQFRQPGGGGTDAGAVHLQRSGIPSISISVPARYLHTASSIARTSDWQNTLKLIYFALKQVNRELLSVSH